ncbi:uncharacterized protein LOC109723399 [Ananas comosus]|uniref:Uncharacterized protein LOC109723399 n=1 Tax=Ananas comosus TaxID=4615 RepID=A0A6P5GMS5_ANACO|nr:uncharacterized protein LOC109723399 [Ananas comosus]
MECNGSRTEALEELRLEEPINKIGCVINSAQKTEEVVSNEKAEKAINEMTKSTAKTDSQEVMKSAGEADEDLSNVANRRTNKLNLEESPIKVGEKKLETQDPLIEVNLGSDEDKRSTYISAKLSAQQQEELKALLKEYKYCFAWSYEEMPGLSREIVEHRLPIKKGFKPYKQPALQRVPTSEMNVIIKPWPFRGWAMDLIGEIQPNSSAGYKFFIVAVDYFTKWVEVKPARLVTQKEIIDFVEDYIIHRFGISETITTDQGTMFTGRQFVQFIESRKIRLLHSSPYYAQANGQAEAANKVIINLMKRYIGKYPRKWNEKLSEVLWACRTSVKMATGMTPFQLVYGDEAVVPAEITVPSLRVENQKELSPDEYSELMKDEMDKLYETRLMALNHLQAYQSRVCGAYNKKVRAKSFAVGDLVLRLLFPIGRKDRLYGKWSPNWEGPFQISKIKEIHIT